MAGSAQGADLHPADRFSRIHITPRRIRWGVFVGQDPARSTGFVVLLEHDQLKLSFSESETFGHRASCEHQAKLSLPESETFRYCSKLARCDRQPGRAPWRGGVPSAIQLVSGRFFSR